MMYKMGEWMTDYKWMDGWMTDYKWMWCFGWMDASTIHPPNRHRWMAIGWMDSRKMNRKMYKMIDGLLDGWMTDYTWMDG